MRVRLMHRDRDFDPAAKPPSSADALIADLGLDILFDAMSGGDRFVRLVSRAAILLGLGDPEQIRYRQEVLSDSLRQPAVVRELHAIAGAATEVERQFWFYSPRFPDSLLTRSVDVIQKLMDPLHRLRAMADTRAADVESEGLRGLFSEIAAELDDRFLGEVEGHLQRLRLRDGVLLSASLGPGNRGTGYVLRRRIRKPNWRERIGLQEPDTYVYQLAPRDEAGARAMGELRGRGIALAADALARSTDHILSYFVKLRTEVAFYVGCLNLAEALARKGERVCLPEPRPTGTPELATRGLYDVCLSLSVPGTVVGNDIDADGKALVVVTGANRGGKSTFLRSLGLAQLMMQCGMFVPADTFRTDVRPGVFTHFRREEDASLKSGKLDEELRRMSAIVDQVTPDSLLLFNESFASTNEREGSEIARQVVRALLEGGVKVAYVTHLFDLADGFAHESRREALFLRAERLTDGRRTFRLVEGEPLPTSHGEDVYRSVFGAGGATERPELAGAPSS
jgi:hypothetical protein